MTLNDRHRPRAQSSRSDGRLPMFNFKNKLQEHAQKNRMGLPVYNTVNEGVQHDPKFRSTVRVRNRPYTSSRTFNQKKRAEQDAARVALESLCPAPVRKVEEYPYPVVHEDSPFCKSILNQFAIDMHLDIPIYKTNQVERSLEVPVFVSSVHLNGFNFTGAKAKNKKEAEQLAARVMVLFFLERGDSESVSVISEIIKSKFDLYAAVGNTKDTNSIFSKARSVVNSKVTTGIVNLTDTSTNQSADSLLGDIVQKQAADPLPDDILQKQAADPLPDDIVQKQAADLLPDDIVQKQAADPLPDNIVQKQAADPLLHPCKKARLESPSQVAATVTEFIPSESVQTLVPPLSESDHEKADAVVALTEVTPSVAL